MAYDLTHLKSRQRLEDVAAHYVQLRRSGARLVGRCPLHAEQTPSFTIDPARQQYRCFGCGAHGDVIDLIQRLERLDFRGAIKHLGGEPAARDTASGGGRPASSTQGECVTTLGAVAAQVLEMALHWWQDVLWRTPAALAYLQARGLDHATIQREGLGYADGRVLLPLRWLRGGLEAAHDLGIIDRYGHDRFSGRIIVPEVRNGRPIWITGRLLAAQPGVWGSDYKYLTLTGVARPLLGYDAAWAIARPKEGLLVCEGPFDRLAALRWGYTAVATGGAWASPRTTSELRSLLAHKHGSFLVPDRDRAGHRGMLTMLAHLDLPPAAMPGVVRLPLEAKDLGALATCARGEILLANRLAAARVARQRHGTKGGVMQPA